MKTIKGFKAFNEGMKCRNKQYSENEVFEEHSKPEICNTGMHFCKMPLDVLEYYPDFIKNEYAEVEAIGDVDDSGNKTTTNKLKINGKISISALFKAHFEIVFEKVKTFTETLHTSGDEAHANTSGDYAHTNTSGYKAHANTSGYKAHANTSGDYAHANTSGYKAHANTSGDEAHANTSGYKAHANTSGYKAHANTSGDETHANTSGDEAISCALGLNSRAKAEKGWIIIVDRQQDKNFEWVIKNIYSKKVGQKIKGVKILPDVWYWFDNGVLKMEE